MGIFGQPKPVNPYTTEGFYIGSPEAEAEANTNQIKLGEVFSDFTGAMDKLRGDHFIVIGRKGTGKTAIAETLRARAKDEANSFCSFQQLQYEYVFEKGLRNKAISREQVPILMDWICYIQLAKLLCRKTNSVLHEKAHGHLEKFLHINAGYVDLTDFQVDSIEKNKGFKLDITHFKRLFQLIFDRQSQIKSTRATYDRLLPSLKLAVTDLLTSEAERKQGNEYILLFDDLDIGVKASDEDAMFVILTLIRRAKEINNELFKRRGVPGKVIVFLRDDIAKHLGNGYADSAKIFSSYGAELNWFEQTPDVNYRIQDLRLKRFIDKRIERNLAGRPIPRAETPWDTLIGSFLDEKSTFIRLLDRTYCTPRDFILFFAPLNEYKLQLPINRHGFDKLMLRYATERLRELNNEMAFVFDKQTKATVMSTLRDVVVSRKGKRTPNYSFAYDELYSRLSKALPEENTADFIETLFDYSVIGNLLTLDDGYRPRFKHREPRGEFYSLDEDERLVCHMSVEMAFLKFVR
ncbi:MAG: hypothetical protein Pars93KO_19720 [Parasphingorhabdus sp.]